MYAVVEPGGGYEDGEIAAFRAGESLGIADDTLDVLEVVRGIAFFMLGKPAAENIFIHHGVKFLLCVLPCPADSHESLPTPQ